VRLSGGFGCKLAIGILIDSLSDLTQENTFLPGGHCAMEPMLEMKRVSD
jgi:hypothetical protein